MTKTKQGITGLYAVWFMGETGPAVMDIKNGKVRDVARPHEISGAPRTDAERVADGIKYNQVDAVEAGIDESQQVLEIASKFYDTEYEAEWVIVEKVTGFDK